MNCMSIQPNCLHFSNNRQHIEKEPFVFMNDINILMGEEGKYLKLNFDRYIFCSKLSSQLFLFSRFSEYQNSFHFDTSIHLSYTV